MSRGGLNEHEHEHEHEPTNQQTINPNTKSSGEYPFVKYFSYQSYDPKSFDPVQSIRDYAIRPLIGALFNPFLLCVGESRVGGPRDSVSKKDFS